MGELLVVRQNSDFGTVILAAEAEHPSDMELAPVEDIRSLTPYGMLLASLGCCTAIVLHTYAQAHGLLLADVQLRLTYERAFARDCEHCESEEEYQESIKQEITLEGQLSPAERKRLLRVADYCPIHKILSEGIQIKSSLAEETPKAAEQKA
jgi:uncharacterized OsmC-like protein